MLSRIATTSLRRMPVARASVASRSFTGTVDETFTMADEAWKKSGYGQIDYTIDEDATVYDAVKKFAAFNIGCLVITAKDGAMVGVVSERDYVSKIALLGRTSKETGVKEIATLSPNLVTAALDESVESCMSKMLNKDIRHLPLVGKSGDVVGMISIKDLVKTVVQEKEKTIRVLSDFALGKGGHYGSE